MGKSNTKPSSASGLAGKSETNVQESQPKNNTTLFSRLMYYFVPGVGFGGTFLLASLLVILSLWAANRFLALPMQASSETNQWKCVCTPLPEVWKNYDVLNEAFKTNPDLFQKKYEDKNLLAEIAEAFNLSRVVKKVNSVYRQHPETIKVELEYRIPVAMVFVDVQTSDRGFLPVDREGYRLPTGEFFTQADIGKYISIIGIKSYPVTPTGEAWGDDRVVSGAQIAAELLPYKAELGIVEIIIHESADSSGFYNPTIFDVRLQNRTIIRWTQIRYSDQGPQKEEGDLSTPEKIAILRKRLAENGEIKADSNKEILQFSPEPAA